MAWGASFQPGDSESHMAVACVVGCRSILYQWCVTDAKQGWRVGTVVKVLAEQA